MAGSFVKFINKTNQVAAKIDAGLARNLQNATIFLANEVKKTLSGQRSGKTYRVPGTKRKWYTASAPGEPPAVRTGRLRSSIKHKLIRRPFAHEGVVGTDVEYSTHLEYGTHKMAARPFLVPTFEKNRENVKRMLGRPIS